MLYSLYGHGKFHPLSKLQAKNHEGCRDAMYKGETYDGDFVADDFNRDDFYFIDLVESFCVPVFSDKFKSACEEIKPGCVVFQKTALTWGKENLLEWVGDKIGGFYTVKPTLVDIIDESLRPMRFWPKLKKFKNENYVITRMPAEEFGIFVDLKKPHMFMCTEAMKLALEARKLSLSFHELPVAIESN
ncbi:hypothetical protein [Rhizobium changzhiense]|uniref:Uncharacterized protein n=1 Tax=Rhizobium changzhiense TaxID=2692317 RepID=A0ABR6A223_9HYPH|nr:hypothetical protein [Rhizobium changzhiense]MBA5800671.1 hypothetical protein [Rhizobium changzhiense]